jgi:hypothetical protein
MAKGSLQVPQVRSHWEELRDRRANNLQSGPIEGTGRVDGEGHAALRAIAQ